LSTGGPFKWKRGHQQKEGEGADEATGEWGRNETDATGYGGDNFMGKEVVTPSKLNGRNGGEGNARETRSRRIVLVATSLSTTPAPLPYRKSGVIVPTVLRMSGLFDTGRYYPRPLTKKALCSSSFSFQSLRGKTSITVVHVYAVLFPACASNYTKLLTGKPENTTGAPTSPSLLVVTGPLIPLE
jgi:hypothetical protein